MTGDEHAKEAQEVAKLGQKGIDATSEAAGFLSATFGEAIAHFGEAVADKALAYRVVNRSEIIIKTRRKLEKLGVRSFKPIDVRSGIPLLEALSEEPDERIQNVWATYIANALDAGKPQVTVNRQLIDVIKQLEPEDLNVLSRISLDRLAEARIADWELNYHDFDIDEDLLNSIMARLSALGLFTFDRGSDVGVKSASYERICRVTIKTAWGEFAALPLLLVLKNAIKDSPSDGASIKNPE